jgi:FkbM family methyltransferase
MYRHCKLAVSHDECPNTGEMMTEAREKRMAFRVSELLRRHPRMRNIQQRVTQPARRTALPVLRGNGRGLRIRFGPGSLIRLVASAEVEVEETFMRLVRPGDVVYDVGANIGWYSMLAARQVGPTGRVIAFEPFLINAAYVRENAISNRLDNVMVIPAGVSDHDGWATFLDKGSLEGRLSESHSRAQAERWATQDQRVKGSAVVPVLSLDKWIAANDQPPPNLLKIDVEGAEAGVLNGMTETLRTAKPTLIIELHGTNVEVADMLDSVGYEHHLIQFDASTRDGPWLAHVLARPRSADRSSRVSGTPSYLGEEPARRGAGIQRA